MKYYFHNLQFRHVFRVWFCGIGILLAHDYPLCHDVERRYPDIANYRFTVNGVSLLNYLAEGGIKWTRFDVEAPDTGRSKPNEMGLS